MSVNEVYRVQIGRIFVYSHGVCLEEEAKQWMYTLVPPFEVPNTRCSRCSHPIDSEDRDATIIEAILLQRARDREEKGEGA